MRTFPFRMSAAAAGCLLVFTLPCLGDGNPSKEFRATVEITTEQATRSKPVTVIISRPLTAEAARPLRDILEKGGQQALMAAIRGQNRGRLSLGGIEGSLDLVVADKTSEGTRYIVVTARNPRYEEINENRPTLDYPFAVLDFVVPDFGSGEGKFYPHAALSIDADGHVKVDHYESEPGRIKDIKAP